MDRCLLGVVLFELVQLLSSVSLDRVQGGLDLLRFGRQLVLAAAATKATAVSVHKSRKGAAVGHVAQERRQEVTHVFSR
jgi:hypothetical protein